MKARNQFTTHSLFAFSNEVIKSKALRSSLLYELAFQCALLRRGCLLGDAIGIKSFLTLVLSNKTPISGDSKNDSDEYGLYDWRMLLVTCVLLRWGATSRWLIVDDMR